MNHSNPSKSEWRRLVNEHCKDCIYDPTEPGNWREQVAGCPVYDCRLWRVRPVHSKYIPIETILAPVYKPGD